MNEDLEAATAIHEAAHAVIARVLGQDVTSVSMRRVMSQHRSTRDGRQRFVIVAFAGPVAEHRYCKLGDFEEARRWEDGWREDLQNILKYKYDEIGMLTPLRDRAEALVAELWPVIERVAEALLQHGALSGDEIDALLEP